MQSRLFVEGGVNKIRLTGGEPTLRRDIVELTRELNALPGLQAIGITTNGIALKRKLPELQKNGMQLLWIAFNPHDLDHDYLKHDCFDFLWQVQSCFAYHMQLSNHRLLVDHMLVDHMLAHHMLAQHMHLCNVTWTSRVIMSLCFLMASFQHTLLCSNLNFSRRCALQLWSDSGG